MTHLAIAILIWSACIAYLAWLFKVAPVIETPTVEVPKPNDEKPVRVNRSADLLRRKMKLTNSN